MVRLCSCCCGFCVLGQIWGMCVDWVCCGCDAFRVVSFDVLSVSYNCFGLFLLFKFVVNVCFAGIWVFRLGLVA